MTCVSLSYSWNTQLYGVTVFAMVFLFLCTVWWHDLVCLRQRWKESSAADSQCFRSFRGVKYWRCGHLLFSTRRNKVLLSSFPSPRINFEPFFYVFSSSAPCYLLIGLMVYITWKFTFGVYVSQILFFITLVSLSSLWGFINRLLVSSLQTLDWVSLSPLSYKSFSCLTLLCTLCPYSCVRPGLYSSRLGHCAIIKHFIISE